MSRNNIHAENETTVFTHGGDHALGAFLDITDKRYANSGLDEQGEGYVLEWSSLFGITTNLIGATLEDIEHSQERLQELVDKFCASLETK